MKCKRLAGIVASAMVLAGLAGVAQGVRAAEGLPSPAPAALDAPRFAGLGSWPVGVRTLRMVNRAQPDLLAMAASGGRQGVSDRTLQVHLWFPAQAGSGSPARFQARLPQMGRGGEGAVFDAASSALRDAQPVKNQRFPLVLISHGYGGWGSFMGYLAEGLASRGYVVAAIDHEDPPFTDAAGFGLSFGSVMLHRARDQRFVLDSLRRRAAAGEDALDLALDPSAVALVGYSMGGFGALATAGAPYDRASPSFKSMPPPVLDALLAKGEGTDPAAGLKALVLLAPWGAQPQQRAWSAESLARIKLPTLLISGDQDDVVDYRQGVSWLFDQMKGSRRHLLVYQNARHNIAGHGAPPAAADFGAREYFEEPVWRKDRLMAINQHFIAAYLDRHLKGDAGMDAFLDLSPVRSNDAAWPLPFGQSAGGAFADGKGASSGYWPGFQRRWAVGLEMHRRAPGQ